MARVILQMGHCFRRTGATGTNGLDGDPNEQEFAQACCYAAASHLRVAGHSPLVIDADEPDTSYRGDVFIAVHCDGSTSATARGASVGYRTAEGTHLGAEFKAAYARRGWTGFRPDNYTAALAGYYGTGAAVRVGNRYALIVEAGFLTSPQDEALLSLPDGPERCARAITDAVTAIFGGGAPTPPLPEDHDMPVVSHARDARNGAIWEIVNFSTRRWLSTTRQVDISKIYWASKDVEVDSGDWSPEDIDDKGIVPGTPVPGDTSGRQRTATNEDVAWVGGKVDQVIDLLEPEEPTGPPPFQA